MIASPRLGKKALPKTSRALQRPVAWRDVLGALQDDGTRSSVLASCREAGFKADDFGEVKPRQHMVEILIRTEDFLEVVHPGRKTERAAIQAVRRRLEEVCL